MTVPDEVDYIVVRMAVPLECTTIATTGGEPQRRLRTSGCTRIVRGGTVAGSSYKEISFIKRVFYIKQTNPITA